MSSKSHAAAALATAIVFASAFVASAQPASPVVWTMPGNVVVPQTGAMAIDRSGAVTLTAVDVGVVIAEQVATTTMDIALSNAGSRPIEAQLLVPVPPGAVVRGFAFEGSAAEPTATLLPKIEARRTYEQIVAKVRDPALLEFAGYSLIRSSVFPIAARGKQKVRLTYEHVLTRSGDRVDYELPRSESLSYAVPWTISVRIKSKAPIATVYSPTHEVDTVRNGSNIVAVRTRPDATTSPGPFRISYLIAGDGVSASLLAHPAESDGGGYFLLLAGLPPRPADATGAETPRREVTLVIDQSGSMAGAKIDQARNAALQVLAGLEDGEAFNIIAYSDMPRSFASSPTIKTRESEQSARAFLQGLRANGGTNIYDALLEALRPAPPKDMLPLVLFLTDGLPTVGQISEAAIRKVAADRNPHHRRIFTFGVGTDVNAPLLDRIAADTRATTAYVLPGEDVEVKVSRVFEGLRGPVLTDPRISVFDADGRSAPHRVQDIIPAKLPDLFEGDQLVLLGRYVGGAPVTFVLDGEYLGQPREFRFTFTLDQATTRNAFVSRLWASRRIASLVDEIRQSGADEAARARGMASARLHAATPPGVSAAPALHSAASPASSGYPRLDELTDEIVRLSLEFGILTEYTSFLAREGTDLAHRDAVRSEARRQFQDRAIAVRSGLGAVNQAVNNASQIGQTTLNYGNRYYDRNMQRVETATVQQLSDRAFLRRGDRWIDSRVATRAQADLAPRRTVEFGGEEYRTLVDHLASQNRQGILALRGDVLVDIDGELVLVRGADGRK